MYFHFQDSFNLTLSYVLGFAYRIVQVVLVSCLDLAMQDKTGNLHSSSY